MYAIYVRIIQDTNRVKVQEIQEERESKLKKKEDNESARKNSAVWLCIFAAGSEWTTLFCEGEYQQSSSLIIFSFYLFFFSFFELEVTWIFSRFLLQR